MDWSDNIRGSRAHALVLQLILYSYQSKRQSMNKQQQHFAQMFLQSAFPCQHTRFWLKPHWNRWELGTDDMRAAGNVDGANRHGFGAAASILLCWVVSSSSTSRIPTICFRQFSLAVIRHGNLVRDAQSHVATATHQHVLQTISAIVLLLSGQLALEILLTISGVSSKVSWFQLQLEQYHSHITSYYRHYFIVFSSFWKEVL